ncbi:MAG: hypothetical protein RL757_713 [Bacteroidota bacterium]|jgi:hypothetical protein
MSNVKNGMETIKKTSTRDVENGFLGKQKYF